MTSEAALGAIRVGSNYTRQLVTLVLNILLVALLVQWLGTDAYGLTMLISATVGLATLAEDVVRGSLVRELAAARHKDEPDAFRRTYNAAWILTAAGTLLTALCFVVAYVIAPKLSISPELLAAARIMLVCEGVYTCIFLLLSPTCNMLQVREYFLLENLWLVARRVAQFAVALVLFKVVKIDDPAAGLASYYIWFTVANLVMLLGIVAAMMIRHPSLRPAPWKARRDDLGDILRTFGWNSAVIVALNIHERIPAFLMNAFFGLAGNAIYGIGITLASYVRMLSIGMTFGLESVAARVSRGRSTSTFPQLVRVYTMLHALAALPGAAALLILGEPMLRLWIGGRVEDPAVVIPSISALLPFLVVAVLVRAISDCWIRIFYGAGHLRAFAPAVLWGVLGNLGLGLLLYWVLPGGLKLYAPVLGWVLAFSIVHFVAVPMIAARQVDMRLRDILLPVARPAIATLVAAPVLIAWNYFTPVDSWNLVRLALAGASFGAVYTAVSVALLTPYWKPWMGARVRIEPATDGGGAAAPATPEAIIP